MNWIKPAVFGGVLALAYLYAWAPATSGWGITGADGWPVSRGSLYSSGETDWSVGAFDNAYNQQGKQPGTIALFMQPLAEAEKGFKRPAPITKADQQKLVAAYEKETQAIRGTPQTSASHPPTTTSGGSSAVVILGGLGGGYRDDRRSTGSGYSSKGKYTSSTGYSSSVRRNSLSGSSYRSSGFSGGK